MADPMGGKNEYATVIGPDASFKGDLSFDSGVRVDGKFEGKLATKGKLHVGKGAEIKAEVNVGNVTVEGQVKGNIAAAEKCEVSSTAQIYGDIRAPRLTVAEGATLVGNMNITPDAAKETHTQKGMKVEEKDLATAKVR